MCDRACYGTVHPGTSEEIKWTTSRASRTPSIGPSWESKCALTDLVGPWLCPRLTERFMFYEKITYYGLERCLQGGFIQVGRTHREDDQQKHFGTAGKGFVVEGSRMVEQLGKTLGERKTGTWATY